MNSTRIAGQWTRTPHAEAAPGQAPPGSMRLPLLEELLRDQSAPPRAGWLDLGPVQPPLIERLSRTRSWIHVADLVNQAPEIGPMTLPPAGPARPGAIHRVLSWDLLNYLSSAGLTTFAERILSAAAPELRIHALIQYRATQMPARPLGFRFDRELQVFLRAEREGDFTLGQVDAPRYSPKALEKAMPGIRADRTTLLNNGMQEFLLRPAEIR